MSVSSPPSGQGQLGDSCQPKVASRSLVIASKSVLWDFAQSTVAGGFKTEVQRVEESDS